MAGTEFTDQDRRNLNIIADYLSGSDRRVRSSNRRVFSTNNENNSDWRGIIGDLLQGRAANKSTSAINASDLTAELKDVFANFAAELAKQNISLSKEQIEKYSPLLQDLKNIQKNQEVIKKRISEAKAGTGEFAGMTEEERDLSIGALEDSLGELTEKFDVVKSKLPSIFKNLNNFDGLLGSSGKGLENLASSANASGTAIKAIASKLTDVFDKINGWYQKNQDQAISELATFQTSSMTRLFGTDLGLKRYSDSRTGFYESINNIARALSGNPLVRQQEVYQNLSKLVDSGIAENIEERAFLATISDSIATTFNAFDSTLLRLIRIQQQDSTAMRLGLEASLTQFLNEMYQDTQYLGSISTSVRGYLSEALALTSAEESIEVQTAIEKWLGSMTAAGVGSSTVEMIAQGLGYVGSGNVSALSSNQTLQTLMAMSASIAGLDYSELLRSGLTAANANQLMYGLTTYLQSMQGANNNVTRAELGRVFGVTPSDIKALQNLSAKDLGLTYSFGLTGQDTLESLTYGMALMGQRSNLMTMLDISVSNLQSAVGMNLALNESAMKTEEITSALSTAVRKVAKFFGPTGAIVGAAAQVLGEAINAGINIANTWSSLWGGASDFFTTFMNYTQAGLGSGSVGRTVWDAYAAISGKHDEYGNLIAPYYYDTWLNSGQLGEYNSILAGKWYDRYSNNIISSEMYDAVDATTNQLSSDITTASADIQDILLDIKTFLEDNISNSNYVLNTTSNYDN